MEDPAITGILLGSDDDAPTPKRVRCEKCLINSSSGTKSWRSLKLYPGKLGLAGLEPE